MSAASLALRRPRRLAAAPAAAALLCGGWAATLALHPWADERVNDLFVYRTYAALFLDGLVPYRDVAFEYPPLAVPPLALAGLAGTGAGAYRAAFAGLMLLCALAALAACGAIARRTGGELPRALLGFAALPLLAGAMVRTHFDLAPLALALAGIAAIAAASGPDARRRAATGAALLAAGAAAKGFPLAAAPVAIAWLAGRGERRAAATAAAVLAGCLLAIGGAWLAVSPDGALDALAYHAERPVQVESTPALALHALDALGGPAPRAVSSHRSDGLEHPAAGAVTAGGTALLCALLAWLALAAARRPAPRALALAALCALVAPAALGKVLSPQFLIWAAPLGALALAWRLHALAAAVGAAVVLTLVEFPAHYFDVVDREPLALALVAARDACLLAAIALAARALARERVEAARPAG